MQIAPIIYELLTIMRSVMRIGADEVLQKRTSCIYILKVNQFVQVT